MAHLVIATEKEKVLTETLEVLGKAGVAVRSTTTWAGLVAALTDPQCALALVDGELNGLNAELLLQMLESLQLETRLRSIGSPIPGIKRSPVGEAALVRLVNRHSQRVLKRDALKELSLMGLGEHPFARLSRIIQQDLPVRIEGERGANKEAVARALHALGGTARPFFKRGPTDPISSRLRGGTLYLKNVDDWSTPQLDRAHEFAAEGHWRIVAGSRGRAEDASMTWIRLQMSPLRDRKNDLEALSRLYIARYRRKFDLPIRRFDRSMWALMRAYRWPDNAKELETFIVQVLTHVHASTIRAQDLPPKIRIMIEPESPITALAEGFEQVVEARLRPLVAGVKPGARVPLHRISVQATERALLRLTLARTGGDQKAAAELLGIARNTFRTKAQAFGLLDRKKRR
jgi:DNA-binding NtrC family response regulator